LVWLFVVLFIVYQIISNDKATGQGQGTAGKAGKAGTAATSQWWGSIVMQLFFVSRRNWYALYGCLM